MSKMDREPAGAPDELGLAIASFEAAAARRRRQPASSPAPVSRPTPQRTGWRRPLLAATAAVLFTGLAAVVLIVPDRGGPPAGGEQTANSRPGDASSAPVSGERRDAAPDRGAPDAPPPLLVPHRGVMATAAGAPLVGRVSTIFALYEAPTGGIPLWVDIKLVETDADGRYAVVLGETTPLPEDLFETGAARWLGVQPDGEAEQPRVRLRGTDDGVAATGVADPPSPSSATVPHR
jgi:hypothetical protein